MFEPLIKLISVGHAFGYQHLYYELPPCLLPSPLIPWNTSKVNNRQNLGFVLQDKFSRWVVYHNGTAVRFNFFNFIFCKCHFECTQTYPERFRLLRVFSYILTYIIICINYKVLYRYYILTIKILLSLGRSDSLENLREAALL